MTEAAARRRRTFAPVAGLGVLAAAVATFACSRVWIGGIDLGQGQAAPTYGVSYTGGDVPGGVALGLVVLAAWGVLLFTRGALRRVAAVIAALAAAGLVAAVVHARLTLADSLEAARAHLPADATLDLSWAWWFYLAAVASLLALGTAALAARWCGDWPEMGSKYDAPGAASAPAGVGAAPADASATAAAEADDDATALDLWKALDAGEDPTG